MSSQESSQVQQYLEQLDQLRLHSAGPSPETTPAKFKKCSECGTLKRKAPSASLQEQPSLKIPSLNPINFPPPQLQRCPSAPVYYSQEQEIPCSVSGSAQILMPKNPTTCSSSTTLARATSDPTVATNSCQLLTLPTTRSPLSPVSEETPNSKRLRRMRKRMEEMRKWVGEAIQEQDEEDHVTEDVDTYQNSKIEGDHQEAVWVEKKGDGLLIHFQCPCGEGYEILLSGNKCYYKLM